MTAVSSEAVSVRPALRLVLAPPSAPPYDDEPGAAPRLRLVAQPVQPTGDDGWAGAVKTPTSALPGAQAFAHRLLHAVLEVAAGVRPVKQLRQHTTSELYETLYDTLSGRPRALGGRPPPRDIRSLHVQERPEGVAEVCGTVQRGNRVVAVALRLEGMDGRWRCTELVGV